VSVPADRSSHQHVAQERGDYGGGRQQNGRHEERHIDETERPAVDELANRRLSREIDKALANVATAIVPSSTTAGGA
jgi:hypothetical protein